MCALHFVETVWAYFLARIQIIEVVRLSLLARGCKLLTFSRPFFDYFAWLPRKMVRIGIIGGTL